MKTSIALFILFFSAQSVASLQYCDPYTTASTPNTRFKIVDNEVVDDKTGLIWQRCALGQKGENCTGQALTYTWSDALIIANQKKQLDTKAWRLPNVSELKSLIEYKCYNPAINLKVFPETPGGFFWTSDMHENYMDFAWYVYFYYGYAYHYYIDRENYVRLVRNP